MQLLLRNPNYDADFVNKIIISHKKGCRAEVQIEDEFLIVQVESNNRLIGRFHFVKDDDQYILERKRIVEGEFYPFEFAVEFLVKYGNKRKITAILWH